MDNLKIEIIKAEGTARGNGWYWLINGVKDGIKVVDFGGGDWYSSKAIATEAAKDAIKTMHYTKQYGWCC